MSTAAPGTADPMATTTRVQPRVLVRASGDPRYAVAVAVDSLGTGLLKPVLLLYGVTVLKAVCAGHRPRHDGWHRLCRH
jgi:hypothetical protein